MKAIEGSPQCIADIFRGHEFEIPEFQRPYSWEKDECNQLWEDLSGFLDSADSGQEKYFLGSIVVYPKPGNETIWCVIDGQQRLTTLLILVKAFFEKATTHTVLQKILYKEDPKTGDTMRGRPRIQSYVLPETDGADLKKTLDGHASDLDRKNLFRINYELLQGLLNQWWTNKTLSNREKIIEALQKNVVMLPIQCSTEDDALTLFQTINDRGRPLDDSDIFKAKIYNAVPDNDRNGFITLWNGINNHEDLFRIYMHISRATRNDTAKEIALRKYMLDHHLGDRQQLTQQYESIMNALQTCHWREESNPSADGDEKVVAEENIYWGILEMVPNMYWCYPLYVFLNTYMKQHVGGGFYLPKKNHDEYVKLMEETVRYFFIKGLVHNAVNTVKDTTFKVYCAIAKGGDYASVYRKDIDAKERSTFYEKLRDADYGRYKRGLVFLNSLLNDQQNRADYGSLLQDNKKAHIEHILPRDWNHYDRWDSNSHKQAIDKLGNLMPLEEKKNSKASNEFFKRKTEAYKGSKVKDALELSQKDPPNWFPADVERRQNASLERLAKFFDEGLS